MKSRAKIVAIIGLASLSMMSIGQEAPKTASKDAKVLKPLSSEAIHRVYDKTPSLDAVDRGLSYLAAEQQDDGSWYSTHYGKNTGITSLALMAFLARGHEPNRGPYGEVLARGISWVIASANGGVLHRGAPQDYAVMYSHGIATLLLGEVLGMVDADTPEFENIWRVHARAVQMILRAQNTPKQNHRDTGGWRYRVDSRDSDISVTGWQLLALRAAQECRVNVPQKAIDRALGYIRQSSLPAPDGGFRYTNFSDEVTPGRTGTGILALEICGERHSDQALRGGDWLLRHPLSWDDEWFYYGAYYSAQAMYQLGSAYWTNWQRISERVLLSKQTPDGSWQLSTTAQEAEAGPAYSTALAILALSVEFRYLPIYQR